MRTKMSLAALALAASAACATPLTLTYSVSDLGGGVYRYEFTLTLDNNDGTWFPGQNFNWITFGDAQESTSPLASFVGELPAPVPFDDEGFSFSGGFHNGPTLLDFGTEFNFIGWVPTSIGETLEWAGTANVDLAEGELLWSNLIGNGVPADFVPAVRDGRGGGCVGDFNQDGGIDGADVEAFFLAWEDSEPAADVNQDGGVDGADVEFFFNAWESGDC
ncbi:MAG: hypothetical protein KF864_03725 [Phycisphaeraceae bacterium]|nr:hypothetical protein [Phycisphaeraceae bacterium]